jgi:hypothetical protein
MVERLAVRVAAARAADAAPEPVRPAEPEPVRPAEPALMLSVVLSPPLSVGRFVVAIPEARLDLHHGGPWIA